MKKQLIALGTLLVLALGSLPSLAACPCNCDSCHKVFPCCPAAPIAQPCCPQLKPCCPAVKPCCPAVRPCCPAPCAMPCPAAPVQDCYKKPTCNDLCD